MAHIFATANAAISEREQRHMALARKLAGECAVLLTNDGTLPIDRPGNIALYGAGVRHTVKGGTGSGDVNTRSSVTIEEGLVHAGFQVVTDGWLSKYDEVLRKSQEAYRAEIEAKSKETGVPAGLLSFRIPYHEPAPAVVTKEDATVDADTAIYVISRNSGEGADRNAAKGDYYLFDEEKASLAVLRENFSRVILVLNVGGVMDLSEVMGEMRLNAILLLGQLGNITGDAAADLITGSVTPSGKLADTWAKRYEDYPSSATFSHNNDDVDDDNYSEGIYVGYRYFDTAKVLPLFPFGYGLSYTNFGMVPIRTEVRDGEVFVTVKVMNTGNLYSGQEVAEVYVTAPDGTLDKPYQELKAFAKTPVLAPGEVCEVTASFPLRLLASYSERAAAFLMESGDYIVRVGRDSRSTVPAAVLRLDRPAVVEQCRNAFARDNEFEELKLGDGRTLPPVNDRVPVILLSSSDCETMTHAYMEEDRQLLSTDKDWKVTLTDVREGRASIEDLVAQLSNEELARLCTGKYQTADGVSSIVGDASNGVPGAAGDTSDVLAERGMRSLIMADGPAGLRLQPHFKARHDGTVLPGGAVFGGEVADFPSYDHPEDVVDYYQYATAIPIGWSLAQSWNTELVREAGSMVGAEMEEFGVDIWLAPAMNIHRNPLCGRNFEYYSEDPVLTGTIASAIVNGVQFHSGKGVSVKHFAANNQEDNRYCTNAHISERALREIYLRGFEMVVRDTQPQTIMTSYNMINGVHTPDSFDLLQTVARDEWGFAGTIMTDWLSTEGAPMISETQNPKYPWGNVPGAVRAGNDLQMPGSKDVKERILKAVNEGASEDGYTCTKADLQFCAVNVIKAVLFAG